MRCKCCDRLLKDWECKTKDPINRKEYLDLCSICRHYSNPYTYQQEEEEVLNKEDINVDSG